MGGRGWVLLRVGEGEGRSWGHLSFAQTSLILSSNGLFEVDDISVRTNLSLMFSSTLNFSKNPLRSTSVRILFSISHSVSDVALGTRQLMSPGLETDGKEFLSLSDHVT